MHMSNGCGPQWFEKFAVTRWLRECVFDWFFEASCRKHDVGYGQGGDEVRRFECDWKFYQAMRRDTLRQRGLKRLLCWLMAVCFFLMVRSVGWHPKLGGFKYL